jgi:NitT/TauT family transport system permease protein
VRAERASEIVYGALGVVLFLAGWEAIGQYRLAGLTWPPLSTVIEFLGTSSRWPLFGRALASTMSSAATGFLIGVSLGLALALAVHLLPKLKLGTDRLAAMVNAIPAIALGPILIVTFDRAGTPAALAAIHVFFLVYVAVSSGLTAAQRAQQDLLSVLGAKRTMRLKLLEAPAALPAFASSLKVALSASILGAILGEWFGAPRGLGVIILNAMENFQIPLLWSAVLLAAGISLALFGLATWLEGAVHRRFR